MSNGTLDMYISSYRKTRKERDDDNYDDDNDHRVMTIQLQLRLSQKTMCARQVEEGHLGARDDMMSTNGSVVYIRSGHAVRQGE